MLLEDLHKLWLEFANWVYSMQALIAGILAAIAAYFTVKYLRRQIKQNDEFRQDDLIRRHTAAKIEATWAILEISKHNDNCLKFIEESNIQKSTYKYVGGDLGAPPEFPIETISILGKLVIGSQSEISKKIHDYIGLLQVRNSRLETLRDSLAERIKSASGHTVYEPRAIHQAILDHYIIKYETNRVLGYCRGDFENIPDLLSPDEAKNEISSFGDLTIDTDILDYIIMLWPKDGWWQIT